MNTIRVLIVDDYSASGESLKALLELLGSRADTAESAADARAALRTNPYDIVLLDYHMDVDTNGLDMLRWMREEGYTMPALIISGLLPEGIDQTIQGEQLGPAEAVAKPMDPEKLMDKMATMTGRRRTP